MGASRGARPSVGPHLFARPIGAWGHSVANNYTNHSNYKFTTPVKFRLKRHSSAKDEKGLGIDFSTIWGRGLAGVNLRNTRKRRL